MIQCRYQWLSPISITISEQKSDVDHVYIQKSSRHFLESASNIELPAHDH